MTDHKKGGIAFLCDFEGAIYPTQMMDFLYQRFAACGMEFAERWGRGEISTHSRRMHTPHRRNDFIGFRCVADELPE